MKTVHEMILSYMTLSENVKQVGYPLLREAVDLSWYKLFKKTKESIVRKWVLTKKNIAPYPCSLENLIGVYVVDNCGELAALYEDNFKNILQPLEIKDHCNASGGMACLCPKIQDCIVQTDVIIEGQTYTNKRHTRVLKNGDVVEETFTWVASYDKNGLFAGANEVSQQRTRCHVDTMDSGCVKETAENAAMLFSCGCVSDCEVPSMRKRYPSLYSEFGYYKNDEDNKQIFLFDSNGNKSKLRQVMLVFQSNGSDMLVPDYARAALMALLDSARKTYSPSFDAGDRREARHNYTREKNEMIRVLNPIPFEWFVQVGDAGMQNRQGSGRVQQNVIQQLPQNIVDGTSSCKGADAGSLIPASGYSSGLQGIQGEKGADSTVPGPAGANGLQGERGLQGLDGEDSTVAGPAGVAGSQGEQGLQGLQGLKGADSTVAGPAGVAGSQGLQGLQGLKGADSTVPGPAGAAGLQGERGLQGLKGADSTVAGPAGVAGSQGLQGERGLQGLQGIAGADSTVPGPAGVAGANGSNGLPGADSTVPGPAGANGLQGERGLQGLAGADSTVPGPAGANGLQGERGLQGFTGSQGLQGVQGIAGADSTVAGPAGATGSQGLQGIQGVKGVDSTSRGDFGNTDLALTGNRVHTAGGFNFSLTGLNDLSFTRPGAGVSMVSAETVLAHTALVRLNTPKTYIGSAAVPVAPSAILEVDSTTKGVLFPRLTTTQKNAIAAPATGLMVVDITLNAVSIFNGTGWVTLTTQTELASEATARTNADTVLTNSVTSIQSDQITLLIYKVSNFATI